jgi:hypothetical protein
VPKNCDSIGGLYNTTIGRNGRSYFLLAVVLEIDILTSSRLCQPRQYNSPISRGSCHKAAAKNLVPNGGRPISRAS